jgi:hypothetical protein
VLRALAFATLFSACSPPPPPLEPPPELSFSDMTVFQYDHGAVAFRAAVGSATGDRHRLSLSNVEVHHRGAQQVGALDIRAPHGAIDVDQNGFELAGGAVVVDSSGRRLKTDRLSYQPAQKTFVVPGPVEMVGRDISFTAAGVTALVDSEDLTFRGPIDGTFKLKK